MKHLRLLVFLAIVGVSTAQPVARTRTLVHHDSVTLEVIAEGRGPVIVLLPSLGRDSEEFDPVAERLAAAGFRVLRPQPRGFGRSAGPMENITLHDLARDVATVLENQKAGSAILAGHAFGHFVAKMTAVDFPKLVRGVILIGAAQKTPSADVQRSVSIATDPSQPEAERLKHLQLVFFAPGSDPRIWLKGFHANVRQSEMIARDATPQKEYWAAGSAPLLDIQGENDPYRPRSSRNELVAEFGAKRVATVLIPHAAHAVIVEQPAAVANAIVAWSRRLITPALRVLASNAVKSVMEEVLPQAERAIGHPIAIEFSSSQTLRQRIASGEDFDLTILTRSLVEGLAKDGKIAAGPQTDIARGGIGIGVRSGARKPDIRTPEALKQALLSAKSITYTKDGASRVQIDKVLGRFGIAETLKSRTLLQEPGKPAASVAAGEAELVITLASEILPVPGVDYVGPFPPELQDYVILTAGIGRQTKQADTARALIKFLTAPAIAPVLKSKGMESPAKR